MEYSSMESNLRNLLVTVGDGQVNPASLVGNLEKLASAVELDIASHRGLIFDTIIACAAALPVKAAVYASLVGLMNLQSGDSGLEIAERTIKGINAALSAGDFMSCKLLVRFAGELVNAHVVSSTSFVALLEDLLGLVEACMDVCGDHILITVLASLPFVGESLQEQQPDALTAILNTCEKYVFERSSGYKDAIKVFKDSVAKDLVEQWWEATIQLRSGSWQCRCSLKPYRLLKAKLSSSSAHELPALLADTQKVLHPYQAPLAFRLFDESVHGELTILDRAVLSDLIVDLLLGFKDVRKDAIKHILALPSPIRFPHLAVEVIVGELLRLPQPAVKRVFYAVTLIDMCRSVESIAPVVANAFEILFSRIPSMDVETVDRTAEWFAQHLSNFDFKWTWLNWSSVVAQDTEVSQLQFVLLALQRLCRLSYYERIQRTLPETFHLLLPARATPSFRYHQPGVNAAAELHGLKRIAAELMTRVRSKEPSEKVLAWIQGLLVEVPEAGAGDTTMVDVDPEALTPCAAVSVVIETLLCAGSKSLSHIFTLLERYRGLLTSLINAESTRKMCAEEVVGVWQHSVQHIVLLLDRLLTDKLLDWTTLVAVVFEPSRVADLGRFDRHGYWEVLLNVIDKSVALCKSASAIGEEALGKAQRNQQDMFLAIFKHFRDILTKHIEIHGENLSDPWFSHVRNRMLQIGRKYRSSMADVMLTLEESVFTSDTPPTLLETFKEITLVR
eukprot:GILK01004851.1.p1 GENE.GILK01004851.1~~GILK01004851.1.p1  ORF type:complete len:767 (+),score=142.34 GILK01004851.1:106-2301(+)